MDENNTQGQVAAGAPGKPIKTAYKVIALLIVLAVIALIVNNRVSKNNQQVKIDKNLSASLLPSGFPKDFPIDVTAMLVKDGSKELGAGQSSLLFVTNLTPDQVFELYFQYFSKIKWAVVSKISDPVIKSLTVKSPDGGILSMTFSPGANSKTQITASYEKK